MSNIPEPPFKEYEERYFLAEILKHSNIPSLHLLQFIQNNQIEPAWNYLSLPLGRSLASCQNAFMALSQRTPATQATPPTFFEIDPRARRPKRPLSTGDSSAVAERILQPRPVTFASVNGPGQISPSVDDGKPRKKRGRPSKEEHDRRVAEAELRGEVYPKPRKPKNARPSMEGPGVETVEMMGGGPPTAMMFGTRNTTQAASISPASSRLDTDPTTTVGGGGAVPAGQVTHEAHRAAESALIKPQYAALGPREDSITALRQLAAMPEVKDVEMGQPETSPGSGQVPRQPGYTSLPGPLITGPHPHEAPMHLHGQAQAPQAQAHELHQQRGQPAPVRGQTPSQEAQSAKDQRQHTDASGNVP